MYTATLGGLGQTASRSAVLQRAIDHILTLAKSPLHPSTPIVKYRVHFDRLVAQVSTYAGQIKGNMPGFSYDETRTALIERGYMPHDLPGGTPVPPEQQKYPLYNPPPAPPDNRNVVLPVDPVVKIPELPDRTRYPAPYIPPVVVPPSPGFPTLPSTQPPEPQPVTAGSKTWLWIAGLLALYVLGRPAPHAKSSRSRRTRPKSSLSGHKGLAGEFANCVLWKEVESKRTGGLIWRCMKQAPACSGKSCVPESYKYQTRACVKTKKVTPTSWRFKAKTLTRCAKYERVCTSATCLDEPFQKPEPSPGHGVNVNKMVRDLARQMAEDQTVMEETVGKELGREIMERGGLRPYRTVSEGALKTAKKKRHEEFDAVPLFMRRKKGKPLDEMASEMGFEDDTELLEAIRKEYPGTKGKKQRKYSADDFMQEAENQIYSFIDAGAGPAMEQFGGLGQDLFPGLRRELVLEEQDIATSDDPLEVHLQRKGWDMKRVRELQASMAEKAVPDLFTGKSVSLTAGERELQRDIDEFTDKLRSRRQTAKKGAQRDPFWVDQPYQQPLLGLAGMSNDKLAQGVRKAVAEDATRQAHGDTSLRAFFITPDLEILPWQQWKNLKRDVGNASVHSHSAENWNYLRQLTGKIEPPEFFSRGDATIFNDQVKQGRVDTDVLIMGDGRMLVVHCDPDESAFATYRTKGGVSQGLRLPKNWRDKKEYKGLSWPEAMRKRQKKYFLNAGCQWREARWKPPTDPQPMLFKTLPTDQDEYIHDYMREPEKERPFAYKKGKVVGTKAKADLTKEFWLRVKPGLYPVDPTQAELFKMPQRHKRATTGERRIMLGPHVGPQQMRLLGEL